eukprot:683946-Amphidinium_carterae.1
MFATRTTPGQPHRLTVAGSEKLWASTERLDDLIANIETYLNHRDGVAVVPSWFLVLDCATIPTSTATRAMFTDHGSLRNIIYMYRRLPRGIISHWTCLLSGPSSLQSEGALPSHRHRMCLRPSHQ